MSLLDIIPGGPRHDVSPAPIRKPGNPATEFPMVCRVTRYPYVTAAARAFGISRVTLYRVLKGQFPDHGDYAARYRGFVAEHSKEAAS